MATKKSRPPLFVLLRSAAFAALERWLGKYITIHFRPIKSATFARASFPTPHLPPYAVVLQGAVMAKDDFTLETLKMYGKLFPGAPLIVSTRADTEPTVRVAMEALPQVHVVTSETPPFPGYGNSNYQISSTITGIKKAEELGAEYVFKTRTDQRLYATDLYPYLYGLTESFPLEKSGAQKKRIVALGYSTIKYRPYSLNDMFFFGTVRDLKLYWDLPFDMRSIPKIYTVGEWQKAKVCEGYFLTSFLKKIGHEIKDTLQDYWEALGSYFIMVDAADLDWYWPKYSRRLEEYHYRRYDKIILGEEVSFKEWLIMARRYYDPARIPQKLVELPNDTHNASIISSI